MHNQRIVVGQDDLVEFARAVACALDVREVDDAESGRHLGGRVGTRVSERARYEREREVSEAVNERVCDSLGVGQVTQCFSQFLSGNITAKRVADRHGVCDNE
jgi:hypothetical protein